MRDLEYEERVSKAARQLKENFEAELIKLSKKLSRDPEIIEYLVYNDIPGAKSQARRADYLVDEIYDCFENLFG